MYKFKIYHDGGFLMDSSDPAYDMTYETYEEAEKEADMMKKSYMTGWDIEGSEYDPDDFEIEIDEIDD